MGSDWGPWIEHDGTFVPSDVIGKFVHAKYNAIGLHAGSGKASDECLGIATGNPKAWVRTPPYTFVIKYRVRKPLGMAVLEDAIADLHPPEPKAVEVAP